MKPVDVFLVRPFIFYVIGIFLYVLYSLHLCCLCVSFFKCFEFVQHLPWPSLSFERNLNATSWLNKGNININNRVHLRFLGL